MIQAADQLSVDLSALQFPAPITHVYNPLVYARQAHEKYLKLATKGKKRIVFLGMNPGPTA